MARNKHLHEANRNKHDEFYTQLGDIENELKHYNEYFKNKVVLCNCDDPYESNFSKYFFMNFNYLGLKKLICTCWDGSPITGQQLDLFDEKPQKGTRSRIAYKIELTEVKDLTGDGAVGIEDVAEYLKNNPPTKLKGNGDFRSPECIEMLKEADIVVTNPPFSLFTEFISLLMKYQKKFLIIGNQNEITYKEVFPFILKNEIWSGTRFYDLSFTVPANYEEKTSRYWVDENGQKWRSMGNICWFTNLDHKMRHEPLDLYKKYTPEKYPKYDNYDAIEVKFVADIPEDYDGVMAVPVSFLSKFCPTQFEIVGCTYNYGRPAFWASNTNMKSTINGKNIFKRLLIRKLNKKL